MSDACTLGAIDAGSNAIRMLIVEVTGEHILPIIEERVPIRLGQGTFGTGRLRGRTIDEAVAAFSRFRALFDQHGVERYRAVATSAVRCAGNRERLIDRLFREAKIELEVIDGAEEGRLVRSAVLDRFDDEAPKAILDLGGGSLEMMRREGKTWLCKSSKIGTVRLLDDFELDGPIVEDDLRALQRYVKASMRRRFGAELLADGLSEVVLCGGNAECLAALFGKESSHGGYTLSFKRLKEELPNLLALNVDERIETYKVRKDRAEVMGVAAIVFTTLAKELKLDKYYAPGVGIRDGIILDLHEAVSDALDAPKEAIGLAAARSFADRLGHNSKHGEKVCDIAEQLFDELSDLHGLPKKCHTILLAAALLHDVGEVVHRKAHHKHSEYLILNGRIPGLEGTSREMVAATARAHRKSMPSKRKHETFRNLETKEQLWVTKMAALLRLADSLDSSRRTKKLKIKAEIGDKKVCLSVASKESSLLDSDTLQRHRDEFAEVFGWQLEVRIKS